MTNKKTLFITVEGIDGSGKTTLCGSLSQWLSEFLDGRIILTHEPYYAVPESFETPEQEYEWYMKDRQVHVDKLINPALEKGAIVLCDRYIDSTCAYQIHGKRSISGTKFAADCREYDFPMPNYTILLDLPTADAIERIEARDGIKLNRNEAKFLQRVRTGYKLIGEWEFRKPHCRFIVIDAEKTPDAVFKNIKQRLTEELARDGFTDRTRDEGLDAGAVG